jgi:hypothetical protein
MQGAGPAWVMASGVAGVESVVIGPETRKSGPPPPAPKAKEGDDDDKDGLDADTKDASGTGAGQAARRMRSGSRRSGAGVSQSSTNASTTLATNAASQLQTNAAASVAGTNKVEPVYVSKLAVAPYAVRLYFAEPEDRQPGDRVFHVQIQGRQALRDFDIAAAAGGVRRGVVREFRGVAVKDRLDILFTRAKGSDLGPVLNGVELILEEK